MFGRISKTEKIYVVDDALDYSAQEALFNFCRNSRYVFGHSASSTSHHDLSRFISNLTSEELSRTRLDELFKTQAKKHYGKDVIIDRAYINVYFSNTPTGVHTDDDAPESISFLAFANPQWSVDWGGETVFFSDNLQSIKQSIMPKGGRIILFDSTIPHSARAPSTMSAVPRFTVTIKGFLK